MEKSCKSHWYDAPPTTLSAAANHMGYGGTSRHPNVTTSTSGFMSPTDKVKLDKATSDAAGGTMLLRDSSGRTKVASPSNAQDVANKTYVDTINNNTMQGHINSETAHPNATSEKSGFMSDTDKELLDTATANVIAHSNQSELSELTRSLIQDFGIYEVVCDKRLAERADLSVSAYSDLSNIECAILSKLLTQTIRKFYE